LQKPFVAEETPQSYGIHTYSEAEIQQSKDLSQEFRKFWNEKAGELCKDKSVKGKLRNKIALQGAIYTSWSLHKTNLPQVKAEEVQAKARTLYKDDIAWSHVLKSVTRNVERILSAHAKVNHLYQAMDGSSTTAEKELEEGMHELHKAQDALLKAIERRLADIALIEHEEEQKTALVTTSPVTLSDNELESLIAIEKESQQTPFEEDPCAPQPVIVNHLQD